VSYHHPSFLLSMVLVIMKGEGVGSDGGLMKWWKWLGVKWDGRWGKNTFLCDDWWGLFGGIVGRIEDEYD